jgi:hypothetical protein
LNVPGDGVNALNASQQSFATQAVVSDHAGHFPVVIYWDEA